MPLWRKLHVSLIEDPDFRRMPDDLTRVVWMLLPLVLDCEGRGLDLPTWVRSKLFPTRPELSDGQVAAALDWLAARGLIERYQVDGERYFRLPRWHAEQGDCSREAPSRYPPPPSQPRVARASSPPAAPPPPVARASSPPAASTPPRAARSRVTHEQVVTNSRATRAPDTDSESDSDSDSDPHLPSQRNHNNTHAPRPVVVVPVSKAPRASRHAPQPPGAPPKREPAPAPGVRPPPAPRPRPGSAGRARRPAAPAAGPPEMTALAQQLAAVLSPEVARRLAARYPERVRRQLVHYRWAERQGRARGPGWLVRAIEEDWPPPPELERRLAVDDSRRYISGRYGALIQH